MTATGHAYTLIPEFLPGVAGRLFSLFYQPIQWTNPKHIVVFFPPFAEEMNKSRRMVSLQAQRLASMGYGVLLVDLFGTGDSDGDFADARLEIWRQDMETVRTFLLQKHEIERITLWGLRLGALLAVDSLASFSDFPTNLLFWSPVLKAEQAMTQFLRLRLAADMVQGAEVKETTKSMREQLLQGDSLEVAGYRLSSELVLAIDTLDLTRYASVRSIPIGWIEIVPSLERPLPVPVQQLHDTWQQAGASVDLHRVAGQTFWNTPEITIIPELLQLSASCLEGGQSGMNHVA